MYEFKWLIKIKRSPNALNQIWRLIRMKQILTQNYGTMNDIVHANFFS